MKRRKSFSAGEMRSLSSIIFEKAGYSIKNRCLIVQAFTLNSYSARHGGEGNAALEFIGSRVLEYYVAKTIAERYGHVRTQRNNSFEGDCEYAFMGHMRIFMNLKESMVNNAALARRVDEWNLAQYMVVGKYGIDNQVEEQEKVKAGLFKAVLGAVTIESCWNSQVLQRAVEKMLELEKCLKEFDRCQYRPEDMSADQAVYTLKRLAEQGRCQAPIYKFGSPEELGYDESGNPKWVCTCTMADWALIKQVWASSKELAEKYAAYLVLSEHFELCNEYGTNGSWIAWKYEDGRLIPCRD